MTEVKRLSIDMSQFHAVFFEESFEGLEVMETGLLELNPGAPDVEAVNTIFRAAHSIKGGSGTFGFTSVSDFTHVMETLLDEMRDGKREVTQEVTNLLLKSVDCLREMLQAVRDGTPLDAQAVADIQMQLETVLGEDSQEPGKPNTSDHEDSPDPSTWNISFHPHDNLYQTGNDPLRLFRELEQLGSLSVVVDTSSLPLFAGMDPLQSCLSWELTLESDADKAAILEIFAWVEDECDLEIVKVDNNTSTTVPDSENDSGRNPTAVETSDRRTGEDRRKNDRRTGGDSSSIRVSTDKVDDLINMVGELVITQSMLSQFSEEFDIRNLERLREGLGQLERNTRELQESVMKVRMLPISFSFNRFPRLVHDLSNKMGKKIELQMSGEQTELDKTVLEKIGDPLVHLVRNSIDHGIEMPDERITKGKPETGVLHLNAFHEGGNIIIEISDDGAGLNTKKILAKARERGLVGESDTPSNEQIHDLIFKPGFSTAEVVSDVSGRGVGMDVVRRNIKDLGGIVEVTSEANRGSTFRIRLPLTLAILDGQLVRVGQQVYIIPLVSIVESLQVNGDSIKSVAGQAELYRLREEYIPIIRLYRLFDIHDSNQRLEEGLLVVVEADGRKLGIFIDDLLAQQQVVIKSLETNYDKVDGISGATILGDGQVALILDIPGLHTFYQQSAADDAAPMAHEKVA